MNKTLAACFSATGNTQAVARIIAETAHADLFPIVPAQLYTEADLNWNDPGSRSSREMKDKACRPAIADQVQNMAAYKTVFLGFPIWWYEEPRIILTFLESYDFNGKAIIPFATSGSSGLGHTPDILKNACSAAHWLPGKRFPEHPAAADVVEWVRELTSWQK